MGNKYQRFVAACAEGLYHGSGAVAPIETSRGGYAGYALVKSFIPDGWTVVRE